MARGWRRFCPQPTAGECLALAANPTARGGGGSVRGGRRCLSRTRNGHNRLTRPATGSLVASGQQEHKADRPQHRQNDCAGDIRRVPSPGPAIARTHQGDVQPDHNGFGREGDQQVDCEGAVPHSEYASSLECANILESSVPPS